MKEGTIIRILYYQPKLEVKKVNVTRIQFLNRIFVLTRNQSEVLKKEPLDMNRFNRILEQKQQEIEQLGKMYEKGQKEWSVEEINIYTKIKELDNENQQKFQRQYEKEKLKAKSKRNFTSMNNAYRNAYSLEQQQGGLFFDQKGK